MESHNEVIELQGIGSRIKYDMTILDWGKISEGIYGWKRYEREIYGFRWWGEGMNDEARSVIRSRLKTAAEKLGINLDNLTPDRENVRTLVERLATQLDPKEVMMLPKEQAPDPKRTVAVYKMEDGRIIHLYRA